MSDRSKYLLLLFILGSVIIFFKMGERDLWEPEKIVEEVIPSEQKIGLEDRFEERVFALLFLTVQHCMWVLYPIFTTFLILSGFFLVNFVRTSRSRCHR